MWSHFKPLRTKFGVVTLVLSCLFLAGWVRGRWFVDRIQFWSDDRTQYCYFSCPIGLGSQRIEITEGPKSRRVGIRSLSMDYFLVEHIESFFVFKLKDEFQWEWAGFRSGEYKSYTVPPAPAHVEEIQIWIVPYWSIVMPLTLLSAWLVLSRPRTCRPNSAAGT